MKNKQAVTLGKCVVYGGVAYGPGPVLVEEGIAASLIRLFDAQPGAIHKADTSELLSKAAGDLSVEELLTVLETKGWTPAEQPASTAPAFRTLTLEDMPEGVVIQFPAGAEPAWRRLELSDLPAGVVVQLPAQESTGSEPEAAQTSQQEAAPTGPDLTKNLPVKFPCRNKLVRAGIKTRAELKAAWKTPGTMETLGLTEQEREAVAVEVALLED